MHCQGYNLSSRSTTTEAGVRRSTRPAWNILRLARPAPRGSARRGMRRSGRRGRPSV